MEKIMKRNLTIVLSLWIGWCVLGMEAAYRSGVEAMLAKANEGRQSRIYLEAALKMLTALAEKSCSWNEDEDNLLTKCTAAYHDKDHEFSIIYGDYYFLEALAKLNDKELFIW